MTFVGKILVILIMVFAIFFLAVSTVVFTTATNWREETKKQKDQVTKLQTQVSGLQKAKSDAEEARKNEQAKSKQQLDLLNSEIATLKEATKKAQDEVTQQRTNVETAQQAARAAQDEAKARFGEVQVLRTNLEAVQKQANEFKLRQTELNDEIRTLKLNLDVAQNNNRYLRDRVAALNSIVKRAGLNPNQAETAGGPPKEDVEGEVKRVDPTGKKTVEITIGSDDGLAVGNVLDVYRMKPQPMYIGRIQIESVDADQATARVVGNTLHGEKIKEGDIVSSKIGSRG